MQKEKIDKALATATALLEKYTKLVIDLIPKYTEAVKKN
jgi:hypothetical protein